MAPAPIPGGMARRDVGLDAVRGVALIAVCLFHSEILAGGWLGVDVFFVVSGFWIARALLGSEHRWRVFALRRSVRLLPALIVLLAAWSTAWWLAGSTVVGQAWRMASSGVPLDTGPATVSPVALGGVTNWWLIAGQPWPFALEHLWSLAVEWQFYLLAPLLVWAVWRWGVVRHEGASVAALWWWFGSTAAVFALANALWVWASSPGDGYVSTLGRAPALLLGVALAFAYTRRAGTWGPLSVTARVWLLGGAGALVFLLLTADQSAIAVVVGIPFAAVLAAGVVRLASGLPAELPRGASVTLAPVAWLGRRSYAAYLWNLPVVVAVDALITGAPNAFLAQSSAGLTLGAAAISIALTVVLAALSWRWVERPWIAWGHRHVSA